MGELSARVALFFHGAWWDAVSTHIGGASWSFAPGGCMLLLCGVPLALVLAFFCYRRTTEGLTLRSRVMLTALRWVSLSIVLLMVAGTVCRVSLVRTERPELLIVVDDSPSMSLPSGRTTRLQAAQEALDHGLLARLSRSYTVRPVHTSDGLPIHSEAQPQSLAQCLIRQAARATEHPLAGILLISDGIQSGSTELSAAARELPAPVYCLTFDAETVRCDVVVEDLVLPPYVYQHDPALISAQIRSYGYAGPANLQVAAVDQGVETPVASAQLMLRADGEPTVAAVSFVVPTAGLRRYVLRVQPVANELTDRNNSVDFHLDVRPERIRVLFIEGEPSWEYRYAREALLSDPVIEFYGWVRLGDQEWFYQGAPKRPDGQPVFADTNLGFPGSREEMLLFDVTVLGDLERKLFEQGNRFALLESYVRQYGGGLATIGGLHVYGAGNYEDTPLARLLPFELVKEKKTQLVNRFKVQATPQGLSHPVMQLEGDPARNARVWAEMPWVEGGNALAAVKPGASLLMVHPTLHTDKFGPRPVAAAWSCGRGRVFSTALDGTWHWRLARTTDTDYHRRYWGLLMRWLARDPRMAQAIGALVAETLQPEVGRPATFSIAVRNEEGLPADDATVDFTLRSPDGTTLAAHAISDPVVAGRYAAVFLSTCSGEYSIKVVVNTHTKQTKTEELKYYVAPQRQEFLQTRPDNKALASLAQASGGTLAPLRKASTLQLPAQSSARKSAAVTIALWRTPGLLAALVLCLGLEWLLRKRRGLA